MAKHTHTTGGKPRADARRPAPPGEDPGTLTDEDYLSAGGPDALDAASPAPDAQREAHADSPPQTQHRKAGEDPERAGSTEPE